MSRMRRINFGKGNKMKNVRKYWLDILTLTGCITFSLTMIMFIVLSWFGGSLGTVNLTFNTAHERLTETIMIFIFAGLIIFRIGRDFLRKLKSEKY